jgi:signal peptidase II
MIKKNTFLNLRNIAILITLAMFFILDRYLKFLSLNLKKDVFLIKDILKFSFFPNEYISFSIPLQGLALNIFLVFLIILIFSYLLFLVKKNKFKEFLLYLAVFLGAISNLFDRLNYSFVIDYLDLKYFTVFNIADVLIVIGCLLIIFFNFKFSRK